MRDRNYRRSKIEKEKKKAKKFFKEIWKMEDFADDEERIGKRAKTRVPCSCWMCGNPRKQKIKKKAKETIQERKFDLEEKYD